jgi:uncharacterized protein YbjT (DUF2867 family)
MPSSTVLVTGAAGGRQGSTGNRVARMLLQRGVPVRAFVHRSDQRSERLGELGADVFEGDLLNLQSVRRAMSGIGRAYFAYPVADGLLDATATFATATREAGVKLVVNLSQLVQRSGEQPTPHQQRHWLSEQIFDWANVGAVHLDATIFYENLAALARGSLAKADALMLPWGPESTLIPMVSADDVARVAVGVLTGPGLPSGTDGTVLPLVGDIVPIREIVDVLSVILGKPVRYQEISDDQWVQAVAGAGINATALEHLTQLWRYVRTRPKEIQAAYKVTESIETIGGTPPKKLGQFLREAAFLSVGSARG